VLGHDASIADRLMMTCRQLLPALLLLLPLPDDPGISAGRIENPLDLNGFETPLILLSGRQVNIGGLAETDAII
jgi:hypothetical protein